MRLDAFGQERLVFREETAARVEWERNAPGRVELLGSRTLVPIATPKAQVGSDGELRGAATRLVFDPEGHWIGAPLDGGDSGFGSFHHPLAEGSEARYRFRSGDTTTIRLADGRAVRLLELQVVPRRSGHRLVSGSLWLDSESFAPVRGSFRFTIPAAVGIHGPNRSWGATGVFKLFMVEYALWQGRWWLPRLLVYEGSATLGGLTAPFRMETVYEDLEVFTDSASDARPASSGSWSDSSRLDLYEVHVDSSASCRTGSGEDEESCRTNEIWLPRDRSQLLVSEHLLPPTADVNPDLVRRAEIRQAARALYSAALFSSLRSRPRLRWQYLDPALSHFNRVEGATLGTSATAEVSDLELTGSAWIGTSEGVPGFAASFIRKRYGGTQRVAAYRRLDAFTPGDRPFAIGNSLAAALFGRDDGDYFRTLGAEIGWSPAADVSRSLAWRIYAELQDPVGKNTDFSIRNALLDRDFRPNPTADEARQLGLAGTLRLSRGSGSLGWRSGLEIATTAEIGSYRFIRTGALGQLMVPLPGPFVGAAEVGGGTAFGELPLQRQWYLGGFSTLRGFAAEERIGGDSYWRVRTEVGTEFPGIRVVGFSDFGTAGPRRDLSIDPQMLSAGTGVSFLSGLIRFDLAHALRGGSGWRLDIYIGGPL